MSGETDRKCVQKWSMDDTAEKKVDESSLYQFSWENV